MQAIVADTTPLNYIVLIQAADILPNLYRTVLIPPAVKAELVHANTPAIVRAWISQPPPWLEVVSLKLPVESASHDSIHVGFCQQLICGQNLRQDIGRLCQSPSYDRCVSQKALYPPNGTAKHLDRAFDAS